MEKNDIDFLNQIVNSTEEAILLLERANKENKSEMFNKLKKFIIQVQGKIGEVSK